MGVLLGTGGTKETLDDNRDNSITRRQRTTSPALSAAAGYGVLAVSHSRRHGLRKGFAFLGVLGAPVVLGLILLSLPTLLAALGLLPTP